MNTNTTHFYTGRRATAWGPRCDAKRPPRESSPIERGHVLIQDPFCRFTEHDLCVPTTGYLHREVYVVDDVPLGSEFGGPIVAHKIP